MVFTSLATKEELAYSGPVSYASLVTAYKNSSNNPMRNCVKYSLEFQGMSLDKTMVAGPPPENKLFNIMIGWRS